MGVCGGDTKPLTSLVFLHIKPLLLMALRTIHYSQRPRSTIEKRFLYFVLVRAPKVDGHSTGAKKKIWLLSKVDTTVIVFILVSKH